MQFDMKISAILSWASHRDFTTAGCFFSLPTFMTEGNAKFHLDVSVNDVICRC